MEEPGDTRFVMMFEFPEGLSKDACVYILRMAANEIEKGEEL